jgi:hypothetical protein
LVAREGVDRRGRDAEGHTGDERAVEGPRLSALCLSETSFTHPIPPHLIQTMIYDTSHRHLVNSTR